MFVLLEINCSVDSFYDLPRGLQMLRPGAGNQGCHAGVREGYRGHVQPPESQRWAALYIYLRRRFICAGASQPLLRSAPWPLPVQLDQPVPSSQCAAELSANYTDLTHNFEESCAERQRLQLRNHGLAQEVEEQQGELIEVICRSFIYMPSDGIRLSCA